MTVYIEYVLIDNLVINALIILLVSKSLKLNVTKTKIFISSLIGALFALAVPIATMPKIVFTLLKILVAVLMVNILKKYSGFKEYLLSLILFFTYTFVLGGACFGFLFMFNVAEVNYFSFTYSLNVPIGFVLITVFGVCYFCYQLIRHFYNKRSIKNFVYKVKIFNNSTSVVINGFLDTGNRLCDKESGEPITIINYKTFNKIVKEVDIAALLLGNLNSNNLKNAKYINFYSASGKTNKILVFEVDKMQIYLSDENKIYKSVKLGLSLKKFKDYINYDALLNPKSFDF